VVTEDEGMAVGTGSSAVAEGATEGEGLQAAMRMASRRSGRTRE
jgi:hypothetical protein